MAAWDDFTKMCTTGAFAEAVRWMDSRESKLVFDACVSLGANHKDAFMGLWDSVPYAGEKISDFTLDLVYGGYMPQKPYGAMTEGDYDNARQTYLETFEKAKHPTWWPDRIKKTAPTVCFYPEYRNWTSLRGTIVQLALDHVNLGPGNRYQANLFCLGGKYTFSIGKQGSHPGGQGTTCMLFARSILHAAGINVIGPVTPGSCSCDLGLNAEIAHLKCYVDTKRAASPPHLKPGDIFHIEGPAFKNGAGSGHVGVILTASGDQWTCIMGGSPDHVTRQKTYTVTSMKGDKSGDWRFLEDVDVGLVGGGKAHRGLRGYWNIDQIGDGNLMSEGIAIPTVMF